MALAALAILGHRSAHSFPIGPVIAEPFISPFGFTITPALSAKPNQYSATKSDEWMKIDIMLHSQNNAILKCMCICTGLHEIRTLILMSTVATWQS
uniref:60S ribosomal protein L23 n=1 Tax=Rhizophora mucronata TaxID=61149 RepID=A0A2P2JGR9_RHIMU